MYVGEWTHSLPFSEKNHWEVFLFFQKEKSLAVKLQIRRVNMHSKSHLPQRAPARPSSVTCQVNESPRVFSVSRSLGDDGKMHFHSSSIRGRWCWTTAGPVGVDSCHVSIRVNKIKFSLWFLYLCSQNHYSCEENFMLLTQPSHRSFPKCFLSWYYIFIHNYILTQLQSRHQANYNLFY